VKIEANKRIPGWKRTKPPSYSAADVEMYTPLVKTSWKALIDTVEWDEIGHMM
jgi:hypothetical protein